MPRIEDTKELYETIYRKGGAIPGYSRYWNYAENAKTQEKPLDYLAEAENVYWGVREALRQSGAIKDSAKLLEVGSGLGYLTYALRKSGYDCHGLDISATAVNQARLEYGNYYTCDNVFDFAENKSECFDLIILTEVIEHIDAPLSVFKALWRLTKHHGRIVITTPNKSFFPQDIIWVGEGPPVHYWWFSEESMSYIARQVNADISFVDFREFYRNHYTWADIRKLRNNPNCVSVLDISGEVIKYSEQQQAHPIVEPFRKCFSRLPFLKKSVRRILNPSIIIGGRRGPIMCAIFEKF
jgi:SAM-dependent methyltransferase